ncbi:MAG: DUF819 family protein [Spirochaetaceae bacterium]
MPLSLLALTYPMVPGLILFARHRYRPLSSVNPVIACYVIGIALGNSGVLPAGAMGIQDILSSVTVALSIPLMLLSLDITNLKSMSKTAAVSLGAATVSVIVASAAGYLLFRSTVAESESLAGLLVGVYTGGTPNLAAIRTALNVDPSLYVTVHTADVVMGGLYLLFVITIAKPLFGLFLKPFDASIAADSPAGGESTSYTAIFSPRHRKRSLVSIGIAIALVGLSVGVAALFPESQRSLVTILTLSTASLAVSAVPPTNRLKTSFKIGEYAILVFCVVVGSMAQIEIILASSLPILGFVAVAVFGSLILHVLLARLFRLDTDTLLITSTAAICSPPFVGMVAVAIRNRSLIPAGITTGIVGYAIGNYLGISVSLLLRGLG